MQTQLLLQVSQHALLAELVLPLVLQQLIQLQLVPLDIITCQLVHHAH
jgi:hypothetical protein